MHKLQTGRQPYQNDYSLQYRGSCLEYGVFLLLLSSLKAFPGIMLHNQENNESIQGWDCIDLVRSGSSCSFFINLSAPKINSEGETVLAGLESKFDTRDYISLTQEVTNATVRTAHNRLNILVKNGEIKKVGHGKYEKIKPVQ